MTHCSKYTKGKEDTFVFVSNSNQHVCKGKKVNHQLRLVPETVTITFNRYIFGTFVIDISHGGSTTFLANSSYCKIVIVYFSNRIDFMPNFENKDYTVKT